WGKHRRADFSCRLRRAFGVKKNWPDQGMIRRGVNDLITTERPKLLRAQSREDWEEMHRQTLHLWETSGGAWGGSAGVANPVARTGIGVTHPERFLREWIQSEVPGGDLLADANLQWSERRQARLLVHGNDSPPRLFSPFVELLGNRVGVGFTLPNVQRRA